MTHEQRRVLINKLSRAVAKAEDENREIALEGTAEEFAQLVGALELLHQVPTPYTRHTFLVSSMLADERARISDGLPGAVQRAIIEATEECMPIITAVDLLLCEMEDEDLEDLFNKIRGYLDLPTSEGAEIDTKPRQHRRYR